MRVIDRSIDRNQLIGFCLIALLLLSSLCGSVVSPSTLFGLPRNDVVIVFDTSDPVTQKAARQVHTVVEEFYSDARAVPVSTVEELKAGISGDGWVLVGVFHGKAEGMVVGSEELDWTELAELLQLSSADYRIIEACHSVKLEELLNHERIHGIASGIDVKLVVLDTLCQLLEIFESSGNQKAVTGLTEVVGQYVITGMKDILQRALFPVEPLGEAQLGEYLINLTQGEPVIRGPIGWLVSFLLNNWLAKKITPNDWYSVSGTQIAVNASAAREGLVALTTDFSKKDLGKGDQDTGLFPIDIPYIDVSVSAKMGDGPWYFPNFVDLNVSIGPQGGALDLTDAPGIQALMEGLDVKLDIKLDPKLYGKIRIGNFLSSNGKLSIPDVSPLANDTIQWLGGGFSIKFHFELGIPLWKILDCLIPNLGTAVGKVLKILGIEAYVLQIFEFLVGWDYNDTNDSSVENILFKVGIGFEIKAQLPSLRSLIKKAIGIDIPIPWIEMGACLRGETGIQSAALFGPDGGSFKVGLFYSLLFQFWLTIFWFLKFDWGKKWEGEVNFIELSSSKPQTNDNTNLDLDKDGLWDKLEPAMGLDPNYWDTDNDMLSDGNEINEFFTDPRKNDTDGDGLKDGEEIGWFHVLGLDPLADYDNDGLPCVLDVDSDNDGLNDKAEIKGYWDIYWKERIKTSPALPDTDFDGLTDLFEETHWLNLEGVAHPHALKPDSDSDGLQDGAEDQYWEVDRGVGLYAAGDYLCDNDSDNDMLLDGLELQYGTDPLDIDTDGDYDLNGNNIIDPEEILPNPNPAYANYPGNLTDYGEIIGNYWPGGPFLPNGPCAYPWPLPTDPTSSDTDGNDRSDRSSWGPDPPPVNPAIEDTDADGIMNEEEVYVYHTNCADPDTDDDGLRDGFELKYFQNFGISNVTTLGAYLNDPDVDDDGLIDGLDNEFIVGTDILVFDTDSDGLADGREIRFGTDPLHEDTDGDTLTDGAEVLMYDTDPKSQDTDNDGLADPVEVNQQHLELLNAGPIFFYTDPRDPDTDDDGITDGEEVYGWSWALNRTVLPGSSEISVPAVVEGDSVRLRILYAFPDPYRARFQTDPVNSDTDGDGLSDGLEKNMVLSPLSRDTDGDGLSDFEEMDIMLARFQTRDWTSVPDIWHYLDYDSDGLTDMDEWTRPQGSTDILSNDTDTDRLSDWEEVRMPISFNETAFEERGPDGNVTILANMTGTGLYTNPLIPDTDGDGILDGDEVHLYGTNPLTSDSDKDGLTDHQELFDYAIVVQDPRYGTKTVHLDPLLPDTDGDGLQDSEEVRYFNARGSGPLGQRAEPLGDYDGDGMPNLLDPDSDDDGIFDGVEALNYSSPIWPWYSLGIKGDPLNGDEDGNHIIDGYQTDYDRDGLQDFIEVYSPAPGYTQPTGVRVEANETSPGGSQYNPWEKGSTDYPAAQGYASVLNHTIFMLADTDNDTFSDGDEVLKYHTDPLDASSTPVHTVHRFTLDAHDYFIRTLTGSTLSNFDVNLQRKTVSFDLEGLSGTPGACNLTVPRNLIDGPWQVLMDDQEIPCSEVTNNTYASVYFTYNHSLHHIQVIGTTAVPEFPTGVLPYLFIIALMGSALIAKGLLITRSKKKARLRIQNVDRGL